MESADNQQQAPIEEKKAVEKLPFSTYREYYDDSYKVRSITFDKNYCVERIFRKGIEFVEHRKRK